jgi:hypothetical protein
MNTKIRMEEAGKSRGSSDIASSEVLGMIQDTSICLFRICKSNSALQKEIGDQSLLSMVNAAECASFRKFWINRGLRPLNSVIAKTLPIADDSTIMRQGH